MPVRNSSRQHFANLKVGVKKKEKKRNVLRTISWLRKKSFTYRFLFELFLRSASFSITVSSPPSSSTTSPPYRRNKREAQCPVPRLVFGAWIKVAFRAAIVRVIRKSYLQRVRVVREERARGMGDEVCACVSVCVCGRVWGLVRGEIFFSSF